MSTSTQAASVFAVGLGSNLGDRLSYLQEGVSGLAACSGVTLTEVSPVYETPAQTWDETAVSPDFLNAVVVGTTTCTPEVVLSYCLQVEQAAGRVRPIGTRWAPRTLDLDLLLLGSRVRKTPTLTLPHPRMKERRFVLCPLADLLPEMPVPGTPHTVADLLTACPDTDRVRRTDHVLVLPATCPTPESP